MHEYGLTGDAREYRSEALLSKSLYIRAPNTVYMNLQQKRMHNGQRAF